MQYSQKIVLIALIAAASAYGAESESNNQLCLKIEDLHVTQEQAFPKCESAKTSSNLYSILQARSLGNNKPANRLLRKKTDDIKKSIINTEHQIRLEHIDNNYITVDYGPHSKNEIPIDVAYMQQHSTTFKMNCLFNLTWLSNNILCFVREIQSTYILDWYLLYINTLGNLNELNIKDGTYSTPWADGSTLPSIDTQTALQKTEFLALANTSIDLSESFLEQVNKLPNLKKISLNIKFKKKASKHPTILQELENKGIELTYA